MFAGQGIPIYSAAYIMPSGGRSGMPKHRMHLQLIRRMLDERLPERLQESKSLAEAYDLVLSYPTLGPFLAFQYVIDLNYSTLMNHSEREFVVGRSWCLGRTVQVLRVAWRVQSG